MQFQLNMSKMNYPESGNTDTGGDKNKYIKNLDEKVRKSRNTIISSSDEAKKIAKKEKSLRQFVSLQW